MSWGLIMSRSEVRSSTATLIRAGRAIAQMNFDEDAVIATAISEMTDRLEECHKAACLFRQAQGMAVGHPERLALLSKASAALAELA